MSLWFFILSQFSVIACAIVGGAFLTFSDFVMRSLDRANTDAGIEVMQVINREVFNFVFMALFLGMTALSPLMIGYAVIYLSDPGAALIMLAGGIYLVGVFGVTMVFNVPMNKQLVTLDHASQEAAAYWKNTYFPKWTLWNTVRTIASIASASCYLIAGTWI